MTMKTALFAFSLTLALGILPASAHAALTSGIVHYYKFDASDASDSVGSLNGTSNSITYSGANGKIGVGGGYNGSSITFPSTILGIANAWTINFWAKPAALGTSRFMYVGANATKNNIVFVYTTTGAFDINLSPSNSNSNFKDYISTSTYGTGSWYMFTITWDGTNLLGYANASAITFTKNLDDAGTMTDSPSRPIFLGESANGTSHFNGAMDEIGIWSRALSPTEVTQLYNSGAGFQYPFASLATPVVGLIRAFWIF